MTATYLLTDTHLDALESLSTALEYSARMQHDPRKCKWFVIALHASVQAMMVLALERGNGLQTLQPRYRKKWLEAYEAGSPLPLERLNYFMDLYEDIKTDRIEGYVDSKRYVATTRHNESMERLNVIRNDWIHFTPKGWSIEFSFLSQVGLHVLDVIEFLALKSEAFHWHNAEHRKNAEAAIAGLRGNLNVFEDLYESAS